MKRSAGLDYVEDDSCASDIASVTQYRDVFFFFFFFFSSAHCISSSTRQQRGAEEIPTKSNEELLSVASALGGIFTMYI